MPHVAPNEPFKKSGVKTLILQALRLRGILGDLLKDPEILSVMPKLEDRVRLACEIRDVEQPEDAFTGYTLFLGLTDHGFIIAQRNFVNDYYHSFVSRSGRFVLDEYLDMGPLQLTFEDLKKALLNPQNEYDLI